MDISERLKSLRKAKDMSVYKLSQLSGVSETGISLAELFNESRETAFLSEDEKELLDCYRHLSQDKAESLLSFLKTLV